MSNFLDIFSLSVDHCIICILKTQMAPAENYSLMHAHRHVNVSVIHFLWMTGNDIASHRFTLAGERRRAADNVISVTALNCSVAHTRFCKLYANYESCKPPALLIH